jgi:hypothetical protein
MQTNLVYKFSVVLFYISYFIFGGDFLKLIQLFEENSYLTPIINQVLVPIL